MRWSIRVQVPVGGFLLDLLDAPLEGGADPVAVIGPNGSGKTTLLRAVAGALVPARGRIRVGGRDLFDSESGVCLAPEERRVGYVPQGYGLFPHMTVIDNVAFALAAGPARQPRAARRQAAAAALREIDCGHLAPRRTVTLSGGEKQRAALARALLPEPDLLLLDEPLAAIDAAARRGLRAFLARRLRQRGLPAIVVTHDARDVLALGSPTVFALEEGRVAQSGPARRLVARPATGFVAEFFGDGLHRSTPTAESPRAGAPRPDQQAARPPLNPPKAGARRGT